MHSALDMKSTLAGNHPHLLYLLASALRPRMLMTLDSEGKLLPVPVRVGQAVDTVAQVCLRRPRPSRLHFLEGTLTFARLLC